MSPAGSPPGPGSWEQQLGSACCGEGEAGCGEEEQTLGFQCCSFDGVSWLVFLEGVGIAKYINFWLS